MNGCPRLLSLACLSLLTAACGLVPAERGAIRQVGLAHSISLRGAQSTAIKFPASQAIAVRPSAFFTNVGQLDADVAFKAAFFTGAVFVTRDGQLVYALPERTNDTDARGGSLVERFF